MKRIGKILICFLVLFMGLGTLAGCQKEPESTNINDLRDRSHKYDITQFVDLKLYGSEGKGFMEITPANITVDDFESEEEYIAVKKAVDMLKLYCIPGNETHESNLIVRPKEGLSNGDVVIIGVKDGISAEELGIDIGLDPFQLEVAGLGDPAELNFFDPINVEFWGLEGTNELHFEKQLTHNLPEEVMEYLEYSVKMDTPTAEEGRSILSVHAELNKDFLNKADNPYYTTDIYLGKMGFSAKTDSEIVLRNVAHPMDLSQEDTRLLGLALLEAAKNSETGKDINNVASIQQESEPEDPYQYLITLDTRDGKCKKADVRVAKIFDSYKVISMGQITSWASSKGSSCTDSYDERNVLVKYTKSSTQQPVGGNPASRRQQTSSETTKSEEVSEEDVEIDN